MFDPSQAGLQAAFRAVRALDAPSIDDKVPAPSDADARDEAIVAEVSTPVPALPRRPEPSLGVSRLARADESVCDLSESESPQPAKPVERGAVYTLEFPTRCPQCCTAITTVHVSRLLRTQVSFTSTLPRKGYIIVCPECEGILSAELSGLI